MIHFYKYQGTGNDFILIDNRTQKLQLSQQQIAFLCNRRMGVGADGLMLLEEANGFDFRMVYYNADGNESTMCGNGGRCITAFARQLKLIEDKAYFVAIDGEHHADITAENIVALEMNKVTGIHHNDGYAILNTGSPHYVLWANDVVQINVFEQGRAIRNQEQFAPKGINVNFVEIQDAQLYVRTYERGVEDETLSCGTGVTASAIAASQDRLGFFENRIMTPGGALTVSFMKDSPNSAINVVLTGPATLVYEAKIKL